MEVKSGRNLDSNVISEDSGIEVTDAEDGLIIGLGVKAAGGLYSIFICLPNDRGDYYN